MMVLLGLDTKAWAFSFLRIIYLKSLAEHKLICGDSGLLNPDLTGKTIFLRIYSLSACLKNLVLARGIKSPNITKVLVERSCSWGKSVTFNWSTFDKTRFFSLQANTVTLFREPFEKHISAPGPSLPFPIDKVDSFGIIFEGLGWQLEMKVLLIYRVELGGSELTVRLGKESEG